MVRQARKNFRIEIATCPLKVESNCRSFLDCNYQGYIVFKRHAKNERSEVRSECVNGFLPHKFAVLKSIRSLIISVYTSRDYRFFLDGNYWECIVVQRCIP